MKRTAAKQQCITTRAIYSIAPGCEESACRLTSIILIAYYLKPINFTLLPIAAYVAGESGSPPARPFSTVSSNRASPNRLPTSGYMYITIVLYIECAPLIFGI